MYPSITEKLLLHAEGIDFVHDADSIYREILLSYRLLFAGSNKSRKRIGRILSFGLKSRRATADTANAVCHENLDGFLHTLCTSPLYTNRYFLGLPIGRKINHGLCGGLFPPFSLNLDGNLIESDTYSARDDFPTFGARLLALQNYNKRRQPSKMTDLWRDRRNPLQWYTFWAVIWVGGAGILLGILQFVVGLVQVIYTIYPAT